MKKRMASLVYGSNYILNVFPWGNQYAEVLMSSSSFVTQNIEDIYSSFTKSHNIKFILKLKCTLLPCMCGSGECDDYQDVLCHCLISAKAGSLTQHQCKCQHSKKANNVLEVVLTLYTF